VTGPSGAAYYARTMETIQTGQRVLARNPELAGGELPDAAVDPATWVNIRLRMPKPTGEFVEITLLRPVEWLAEHLAQTTALDGEYPRALEEARGARSALEMTDIRSVIPSDEVLPPALGGIPTLGTDQTPTTPWIFLALHELAAVGPAEVVRVEPCPPIEPGTGRLVTGTFSHHSGEVLAITVDGLTEPIGCTGAHPLWSEDRQDFIPTRNLVLGETLRTESGTLRQITRITPRRGPPVPVFNLEVDAKHVYYVSGDGVLVHNAYHESEFFDDPTNIAGQWQSVNESMLERARAYQQQITGRSGQAYFVDGVKFDGVANGGLIDAKGPGYANFVKNGRFRHWFNGADELVEQAQRQVRAANGTPIRWHVAEADAVTAIRNLFADSGITGIDIIHTPVVP
jgi:hypothetical protein